MSSLATLQSAVLLLLLSSDKLVITDVLSAQMPLSVNSFAKLRSEFEFECDAFTFFVSALPC